MTTLLLVTDVDNLTPAEAASALRDAAKTVARQVFVDELGSTHVEGDRYPIRLGKETIGWFTFTGKAQDVPPRRSPKSRKRCAKLANGCPF